MKKSFKRLALVASLAFAGLFGVIGWNANNSNFKEAKAGQGTASVPPDYFYVRLASKMNGKINNTEFKDCYTFIYGPSTYQIQFTLFERGDYTYGKVKVPTETRSGDDFIITTNQSGYGIDRTANKEFRQDLDLYVMDYQGSGGYGYDYCSGYHTRIIYFDMNDSTWAGTDYANIYASFNGGSSFTAINECDDFEFGSGGKLGFIELPKSNENMDNMPTTVIFRYGESGSGEYITSAITMKGSSNWIYKLENTIVDGHPAVNPISTDNYTATFKNDDGTILQETTLPYGETPVYSGETPSKIYTSTKYYEFNGWSSTITYLRADTIYTATYTETTLSPSSNGWFGGETYFFVDKQNNFSNCLLRIRFWDDLDHDILSVDYKPDWVYNTSGSYNTYRVIIPEYDGDSLYGWTKMIICRYQPDYASDTTVDWDHVWNKSNDLSYSNYKSKTEWWCDGYKSWPSSGVLNMSSATNDALNGYSSGITRYFDMSSWDQSGRTGYMALYFMGAIGDGNSGFSAWVLLDKKVLGTGSDYSGGLWEYTVPYADDSGSDKLVTWHQYIIVELKEGAKVANWDNKLYQSADISFTNQYNVIKGGANQSECTMDYDLAEITRLTYFVNYFNSQLDTVCDADGNTNITNLNTAWTNVSKQYPLEHRIQVTYAETDPSPVGNLIQKSAARYDYVLKKYNGKLTAGDFAERSTSGHFAYGSIGQFKNLSLFMLENDLTIVFIIASSVSLISITALSVLFIRKKRKRA